MTPTLNQLIDGPRCRVHFAYRPRRGAPDHHKGEIDLVTEMDHLSEDYLIGQVRAHFPEHAIVSEEAGSLTGTRTAAGTSTRSTAR